MAPAGCRPRRRCQPGRGVARRAGTHRCAARPDAAPDRGRAGSRGGDHNPLARCGARPAARRGSRISHRGRDIDTPRVRLGRSTGSVVLRLRRARIHRPACVARGESNAARRRGQDRIWPRSRKPCASTTRRYGSRGAWRRNACAGTLPPSHDCWCCQLVRARAVTWRATRRCSIRSIRIAGPWFARGWRRPLARWPGSCWCHLRVGCVVATAVSVESASGSLSRRLPEHERPRIGASRRRGEQVRRG